MSKFFELCIPLLAGEAFLTETQCHICISVKGRGKFENGYLPQKYMEQGGERSPRGKENCDISKRATRKIWSQQVSSGPSPTPAICPSPRNSPKGYRLPTMKEKIWKDEAEIPGYGLQLALCPLSPTHGGHLWPQPGPSLLEAPTASHHDHLPGQRWPGK